MRTRAEIKREIVDAFMANEEMQARYGFDSDQSFESQFSLVSYENVLFEIIAFSHYILEQIFGVHKRELDELIASKKIHNGIWIRDQLLNFQYGFNLIPGTDQWNNAGKTEDEIQQSKIIKYAAVTESSNEKRVICKVATEINEELQPLTPDEIEAVSEWLMQIKAAGVPYTLINYLPDLLQLNIRIYRDPLILTSNGVHRVDGTKPVEDALKAFMKELPFNGELRLQDLSNKLEQTEGVNLVQIDSVLTSWIDPGLEDYGAWEVVDVRKVPESGYFKIEDFNGINYLV